MSKDVNKVIFLGNVGQDPEIKVLPSGTRVANFSLATTERFRDEMGEYHDRTEWHYLVALNKRADVIRDYVQKGSKIFIEGKQQTRSWTDKSSGEKRYRTEVLILDISLLSPFDSSRNGQNGNGHRGHSTSTQSNGNGEFNHSPVPQEAMANTYGEPAYDDDIPF